MRWTTFTTLQVAEKIIGNYPFVAFLVYLLLMAFAVSTQLWQAVETHGTLTIAKEIQISRRKLPLPWITKENLASCFMQSRFLHIAQ